MNTSDEKKCPFCAEIIKAEAVKCRFCGSDLNEAVKPGNDSSKISTQPRIASCPECNVALIATQKKSSLSIAGLIGVLLFIIGLIAMLINIVAGILLMILALIISVFGRGSKTIMACPQCGKKGVAL
jgi:hypothetical protein